jgi:formylmethanofuran dehydrogenase subunit B
VARGLRQPTVNPMVWTCPFCPLRCDHLSVRSVDGAAGTLALDGGTCGRAQAALQALSQPGAALASIDGTPCSLDAALEAAAQILGASRQPLFAGMATDVAGARALYPLACATGAICDGDAAALPLLRALQDRGQFTATLAEVRTRADVIVFVGGVPLHEAPLIGARCGIGQALVPQRHVVVLGPQAGDEAALAAWQAAGVSAQSLPLHDDDLLATLSLLAAPQSAAPWVELNQRLRSARYAVFIGTASRLPPAHGALVVEAVNRLVDRLNASTRAAALWLGAPTAQAVFTWLSGLPLRTRCGPYGLEHEPLLFDARRLLDDHAVDALLWVSSFEPLAPPPSDMPLIVLGPPPLAGGCTRQGAVFIAVATPGIGASGHVFRTDGTVLMPLHAVRDDGLPTVADVARPLLDKVNAP